MNKTRKQVTRGGVAATISLLVAAASAQPQADSSDLMAGRLPAPAIAAGELPRPCVQSYRDVKLEYATPAAKARVEADMFLRAGLQRWGEMYFKPKNGLCLDLPFVVRKFQQTGGAEPTGILTDADVDRLVVARTGGQKDRVAAQSLESDLRRTVADFLPKGSERGEQSCGALQARMSVQLTKEVAARLEALPPRARSSAQGEIFRREMAEKLSVVAPQWKELWTRETALVEWAQRHGCRGLRFGVEYWQASLGLPTDVMDPQGVGRTLELLSQAKTQLAAAGPDQERRLRAEAESSGETARTRTWAFDDVNAKMSLQTALERMPPALCTAQAQTISCGRPAPCASEASDLQAAQSNRQAATRSVSAAEVALKACQMRLPYSAVTNSALTFAGAYVKAAEFTFSPRGMSGVSFSVSNGQESVRSLLIKQYGTPESQQETRTRYVTVSTGGGVGLTTDGQSVNIAPQLTQVPESYSVTRYVWHSPAALIEESTGTVTMRFVDR